MYIYLKLETDLPVVTSSLHGTGRGLDKRIQTLYSFANTAGAQVFEDSSAEEKYLVTTPSSAIKENLLVRGIIGLAIVRPRASVSSPW
jgi:hypothetical protein